jgi:Yip1-like protein
MDLKTRATNILTKPATEWPAIAAEATTPMDLITSYAAPLSAVAAISAFIGLSIVGMSVPLIGTTFRTPIFSGLTSAIVRFVLGLVGLYVSAIIIEKLAPTFQSKGDTTQAMKLVVFASTPVWVASVLQIIPALGILVLLAALYAVYLFYLGLTPVMQTPGDKVIPYMVVAAIVIFVLNLCFGFIAAAISGAGTYI